MSRHEGVSCDSCLKGNFRGRRYKCLVCFDYDLCASCYEAGATTTRHLTDHPMQCILTRTDFELYYGGEGVSVEQPQSLTCPYCTRMGFTEATLQEHVTADHPDTNFEVVCPLCAFIPGGDPNHVTDDFANHLTVEHRSGPRDLISFLDEPTTSRHGPRRIPHPSRGVGGQRPRRSNMIFSSSGGLSPSSRDSIDPIAELLSQLSGVRRTGGSTGQSSQLQQLQMQLQLERQQVRAATRHQLDRLPRRQPQVINSVNVSGTSGSGTAGGNGTSSNSSATMAGAIGNSSGSNNNTSSTANPSSGSSSATSQNSMLLLPRCITTTLSDSQLQSIDRENANRSLFVRELVIGTLAQTLPELTQQNQQQQQSLNQQLPTITTSTSTSNMTTSSNVENSNACGLTTKKLSNLTIQDMKREQQLPGGTSTAMTTSSSGTLKNTFQSNQPSHQQLGSTANGSNVATALQSHQGLQTNPTISVQSLMHSVLPQSLVLQQALPPPVRNTGTGTIREPSGGGGGGVGVGTPAPGYLRGGVGPVGVTGSSRRKPVRSVDGRNQSTEPPPPH